VKSKVSRSFKVNIALRRVDAFYRYLGLKEEGNLSTCLYSYCNCPSLFVLSCSLLIKKEVWDIDLGQVERTLSLAVHC